jgi:Domain of unknown function (DUF222)
MGNVAVEPLDRAIDGLLALDPDTLTDTELHEVVVGLQLQAHRLAAARAKLTAAWDGRQIWADDGSRSPGHRLAREATMSVASAKREVRRARALRTMPATAAAVAAGDLSPGHVDLLARANDGRRRELFADHESVLVERCKRLRFADAVKLVEYWRQRADADSCEDEAERRDAGRSASVAPTIDGMIDVRAWLDPFGGAEFKAEFDRLVRELYLDDQKSGRVRTGAQRRADALVEMARRSRASAPGGIRPRPLITVLCGETSFTRMCELADGTVITPGQVAPHLTDADVESILFDGPDRIISVSRRRRFTGALRRAIEVRDRHCQHPSGCDEPADRCDVDHVHPYIARGVTSQENGRLECWPHNRKHHLHDHGGVPRPPRPITPLDELRARLRCRVLRQDAAGDDPDS